MPRARGRGLLKSQTTFLLSPCHRTWNKNIPLFAAAPLDRLGEGGGVCVLYVPTAPPVNV